MKSDASVLVVDDNITRRDWILNVLGKLRYSVVTVPSAYQTLRLGTHRHEIRADLLQNHGTVLRATVQKTLGNRVCGK